jgi:hypothetical protein
MILSGVVSPFISVFSQGFAVNITPGRKIYFEKRENDIESINGFS